MPRAKKARKVGRKRTPDVPREPSGQIDRKHLRLEMEQSVTMSRARQQSISGAVGMPVDVLGIARGHGYITEAMYSEGRKLERLMSRLWGPAHAHGSAIFQNVVTPATDDGLEVHIPPLTDDEIKERIERSITILDSFGRKTRDVVVNAARYGRYPTKREEFGRLIVGLTALEGAWEPRKITVDRESKAA